MDRFALVINKLQQQFAAAILEHTVAHNELTIVVQADAIVAVCEFLRTDPDCLFAQLMDLCGVDYAEYGKTEWSTHTATSTGFSRGVTADIVQHEQENAVTPEFYQRFAVVYHLLSLQHNVRVRLKVFVTGEPPCAASVTSIWSCANWFEREAFDLFGIVFAQHQDLRRILTDYGFIGHPFRKDFPLIGTVEVRYDATEQRVIYEPVQIQPRVLVPKVIATDTRYMAGA